MDEADAKYWDDAREKADASKAATARAAAVDRRRRAAAAKERSRRMSPQQEFEDGMASLDAVTDDAGRLSEGRWIQGMAARPDAMPPRDPRDLRGRRLTPGEKRASALYDEHERRFWEDGLTLLGAVDHHAWFIGEAERRAKEAFHDAEPRDSVEPFFGAGAVFSPGSTCCHPDRLRPGELCPICHRTAEDRDNPDPPRVTLATLQQRLRDARRESPASRHGLEGGLGRRKPAGLRRTAHAG